MEKTLVAVIVEHSILEIAGVSLLDKINEFLYQNYNASTSDCLEHPEYLNAALESVFGNASKVITTKIANQLEDYVYQKSISQFVHKISI